MDLSITPYLYQLSNKGYMAWEYNPFHNFRITQNIDSEGLNTNQIKFKNQIFTTKYINGNNKIYENSAKLQITYDGSKYMFLGTDVSKDIIPYSQDDVQEAGSILDLDTDQLKFDLNHPVSMDIQPSYDGTVNVILNDNKNIPRLINSRFSTTELNTYEVVDRIGDNDTNIYSDNSFKLDTSLYKRVDSIPEVKFLGVNSAGELKVGNYCFYFKYSDADGNETDFVADTGIVAIFKGNDRDPFSIDGGISNENAYKGVSFLLTNIDYSYNYLKVYYTRSTGDSNQTIATTAFEIDQKYIVKHQSCVVNITGLEPVNAIPLETINNTYFQIDTARTQAQCQNRLFLANVSKPSIPYEDLTDISLRILPTLEVANAASLIGEIDTKDYNDNSNSINDYEYYNTKNIYYNVGYWNKEIYKLGIVYILEDNTLTPVFNIRGGNNINSINDYTLTGELKPDNLFDSENNRKYITIDEDTNCLHKGKIFENSKGVVRFVAQDSNVNVTNLYFIKMNVPKKVLEYLKSQYNIKGFFFVRQKRNPLILAQAYIMPYDKEAQTPILYDHGNNKYFTESFLEQKYDNEFRLFKKSYTKTENNRRLINDYDKHLYVMKNSGYDKSTAVTAICPDFMTNQSRYNSLFTGTDYVIENAESLSGILTQKETNHRMYYTEKGKVNNTPLHMNAKIVSVTDDCPSVAIDESIFRSRLGSAEEAYKFRYAETNNRSSTDACNLIRGIYSPYLGMITTNPIEVCRLVNIYIPNYSETLMSNYFQIRYDDVSDYHSIGDRIDINTAINDWKYIKYGGTQYMYTTQARGDCYICTFTHRLNRNFSEPVNPYNDEILEENTWKDNYDAYNSEKCQKINRGDVNAVQLGSWITFRLRSSTNLSLRSVDESNTNEIGIYGRPRSWYPHQQDLISGNNKIPESYVYNQGLRTTLNEKDYAAQSNVPYIKNIFQNRIIYSNITLNDGFQNGYRVFITGNHQDYTKEYGAIMKLVPMGSSLICVFEHGVALIPVNERVQSGSGKGGDIFSYTTQILPPNIAAVLSDMVGSQWAESVVKTPYAVYGVDTVAKKIWRTDGQELKTISDFKVNKFLIDNLSLSERETDPIIGVRNVKTHYNANKNDVIFTFYDQKYGFEDKAWSLCYNELTQSFTTFYSWIPSYSENIDNIYFSFDRNVSKQITKLGTSNYVSSNADGVVLDNPILDINSNKLSTTVHIVKIANRYIPESTIKNQVIKAKFSIEPTFFKQHKYFSITGNDMSEIDKNGMLKTPITITFKCNSVEDLYKTMKEYWYQSCIYCNIKSEIVVGQGSTLETLGNDTLITAGYYNTTICVTTSEIFANEELYKPDQKIPSLLTDFWKHGQAGIIDVQDHIKPCYWYNKQHPFEFEFVVHENLVKQKIWDNLQILSNKAEPESFHYEINGDCYEFSNDKENMWYRQEATKNTYQNLGSNTTYDHLYNDQFRGVVPKQNKKSTIFPLYYNRKDTVNLVEDKYIEMTSTMGRDYARLSGSEIVRNEDLNQFDIVTHVKNNPITKEGVLKGNSYYQEDEWYIQIPPINLAQKNEDTWEKPPLVLSYLPDDLTKDEISGEDLPNTYDIGQVETNKWSYRKQAPIKDKVIKIKIRYTGNDLAIINGVITTYRLSYV